MYYNQVVIQVGWLGPASDCTPLRLTAANKKTFLTFRYRYTESLCIFGQDQNSSLKPWFYLSFSLDISVSAFRAAVSREHKLTPRPGLPRNLNFNTRGESRDYELSYGTFWILATSRYLIQSTFFLGNAHWENQPSTHRNLWLEESCIYIGLSILDGENLDYAMKGLKYIMEDTLLNIRRDGSVGRPCGFHTELAG